MIWFYETRFKKLSNMRISRCWLLGFVLRSELKRDSARSISFEMILDSSVFSQSLITRFAAGVSGIFTKSFEILFSIVTPLVATVSLVTSREDDDEEVGVRVQLFRRCFSKGSKSVIRAGEIDVRAIRFL